MMTTLSTILFKIVVGYSDFWKAVHSSLSLNLSLSLSLNDASKTKALRVYDTREDMFGLCRALSMEEEVIIFQLKCEVRRIVEDILS